MLAVQIVWHYTGGDLYGRGTNGLLGPDSSGTFVEHPRQSQGRLVSITIQYSFLNGGGQKDATLDARAANISA